MTKNPPEPDVVTPVPAERRVTGTIDELFASLGERGSVLKIAYDRQHLVELQQLGQKYTLRVTPLPFQEAPDLGDVAVEILEARTGKKLGEYVRNYASLFKTFYPFSRNGREYALYSKDYTATRVMSLPECRDLGGEERTEWGFCPVEYVVAQPADERGRSGGPNPDFDGSFGFVAGCVWGDDSSYKVQYLDLRRVSEGNINREARFGYIELPDGLGLREALDFTPWAWAEEPSVRIKTEIEFDLRRSVSINFRRITSDEYERQRDTEDPTRLSTCANCDHLGKDHVSQGGPRACWVYVDSKADRCGCVAFEPATSLSL